MSTVKAVEIESSWKEVLEHEFQSEYFAQLKDFLLSEKTQNKIIYPPGKEIFTAFNNTPFQDVKVVILGQDPYHGSGQAHGLCFSVNDNVRIPPSLLNIFKELHSDLGIRPPGSGNLLAWAKQGILLLNATLTVEKSKAGSHQGKGWETFTDSVIQTLSQKRENLVFILWGNYAGAKSVLIDERRHHIIKSTHPSPFSAHRGFMGSRPFSRTNEYLVDKGIAPIDWELEKSI
jgi:uracil-DNA glycosylase